MSHTSIRATVSCTALLIAVKEQLSLVDSTTFQHLPIENLWTQQQWWEAFNFFFINGEFRCDGMDDLIFLVWSEEFFSSKVPYKVIRRAKVLPNELNLSGPEFSRIDWKQSFVLNLVLQHKYRLSIIITELDALHLVSQQEASQSITVQERVYASPIKTPVNLDNSKAAAEEAPEPCYPNICFAVDNFHETFSNIVLSHEGSAYCVLLHADASDQGQETSSKAIGLFAGYVSYSQVIQALPGLRKSPFWLKLLEKSNGDWMQLLMHGPSNIGIAEVAVCNAPKPIPDVLPMVTASLKSLFRQILGKKEQEEAVERNAAGPPILCSLMMLTLPVNHVASMLLQHLPGSAG